MSFITTLIQSIDKSLDQYIFNGYHAIVSAVSTTVTTLLIIYFAGLGWLVIRGLVPLTPMALAWHMIKAAFILTIALKWDYFSYFIVTFFTHGMDRLTAAVLTASNSSLNIDTITNGIAKIWQDGTNLFAGLWRASGPSFFLGDLVGVLGFVMVIAITAIPLFYILMSKVALSVLLILAPIIMPLFLWNATRGIFNGWLRLLVQWMLTPLLIYAFAGLYLTLILAQITQMTNAAEGPTTAGISAFILLGLIMMATFKQAGKMSRDLAQKIELKDVGGSYFDIPARALKALRPTKGT